MDSLLIVTLIVGFCNCSMFCCALLCVHSCFAITSMEKRELVAWLCLYSWCLVIAVWLFLTMPRVCLQFVIVVFPYHTHLLFLIVIKACINSTAYSPKFTKSMALYFVAVSLSIGCWTFL